MINKQYVEDVIEWLQGVRSFLDKRSDDSSDLHDEIDQLLECTSEISEDELSASEIEQLQQRIHILHHNVTKLSQKQPQDLNVNKSVPIGKHTLPPLPYPYNALEPVISEEIMKLHHDKHHQTYVDGLNKAERMMQKARETNDFSLIKHWEREAAFHGSGHYLHTLFWENMDPRGGEKPKGSLLKQIDHDFGSFEAFKKHFSEAAKAVEGIGWAILVWAPRAKKLEILQSERHMILTQWDTIPLLVLDVWEHAYYLQYKTDRAAYVDNWWEIVNWPEVQYRFDKASQLTWKTQ
ncbi:MULTISPECIES: superoxide dismutase [Bacillaceae]|uniref:superoxide dismutase n=1 Tax=Peribacillus huizhouensis TaxID=1501239 RepID=A0ABR6CQR3_9BACI|nr:MULTISPECIES: superoxide dismutase [Bacillaceae]MBA9027251.1 Fe-Mn family superoxide dismutase [Peribacillus huizhouensis]